MEPTRKGGVLDDLARQLVGTPDPALVRRRRRAFTVQAAREMALDLSVIVGLAMGLAAFLALVIWAWTVVL